MIFEFNDYTSYLRSYIKSLPREGHGEARKIAQALGVSSTFVSHVLSGVKQLTPEQAGTLSTYLGLSGLDADYFFYLVQMERAGTSQLKKYCQGKLKDIKEQSLKLVNRVQAKKVLSDEEKSIFYSNPLYSVLHLYTSTKEHGCTLEDFCERFDLSRQKVMGAVNFLLSSGLIVEKNGYYTMGTQSTHMDVNSPHFLRQHTNWRMRSIQAAEELNEKEMLYTVNVSLSKNDFDNLREKMVVFIQDFLKQVHASPAEDIACFNLDFFWIRK